MLCIIGVQQVPVSSESFKNVGLAALGATLRGSAGPVNLSLHCEVPRRPHAETNVCIVEVLSTVRIVMRKSTMGNMSAVCYAVLCSWCPLPKESLVQSLS